MDKIYIVTMYRYGNRESHSYVLGCYSDIIIAKTAAGNESDRRGKKYDYEILSCNINTSKQMKIEISNLED